MSVEGLCDERFAKVRELFQGFVDSGEELGASIAVNINGTDIIDLWGGWKNSDQKEPWTKDTLVNVWSSTKTVTALTTLILADRGLLSVNDKVAKHWPAFGANGKENIEVRHLLSHTSGVSGWEKPVSNTDILDLEKSAALLAAQPPWWEPGTASGYHALNMGHLLQKVIQGATSRPFVDVVKSELIGPLKADFHIGCPESEWGRVARVVPPAPVEGMPVPAPGSVAARTFGNPVMDARVTYRDDWKRAEVGAANGHANARSMCKLLSAVTLGGLVDGKRILSQETIDLIWQEQSNGIDLVLGLPLRFGMGFCLGFTEGAEWMPQGRVCFWGGWGGSLIVMDLDRKVTFAYAMNRMELGTLGNPRTMAYLMAVYEALAALDDTCVQKKTRISSKI